jgi:hypothetical protein
MRAGQLLLVIMLAPTVRHGAAADVVGGQDVVTHVDGAVDTGKPHALSNLQAIGICG